MDMCVSGTLGSEAGHTWWLLAPGGRGVRVCLPGELSRGLEQNAEGLGQWIRRTEGGTGQREMTPTIQEMSSWTLFPGASPLLAFPTCTSRRSAHATFPLAFEAFCAPETGPSQGVETGGGQFGSVQGQRLCLGGRECGLLIRDTFRTELRVAYWS